MSGKKTCDEFFESYEATRLLRENLDANMDVFGHRLTDDEKRAFMRVNLIMIRQCLEDFGAQ